MKNVEITKKTSPFEMIKKRYQYEVWVGWFENKPHKEALEGTIGSYAGGNIRKTSRKGGTGVSYFDVIKKLNSSGRDVLNAPLRIQSAEIKACVEALCHPDDTHSEKWKRMVQNLAIATLFVPMAKGKYKKESKKTIELKGFSRPTVDTGQLLKGISAKITN